MSAIAKKESISVHYLEQILNALKKKGLVKSVRGPQGGYVLAQRPSEISLEKLFYALESRQTRKDGAQAANPDGDEVSIADSIFWQKFFASIEKGLSSVTLKQLLDEARHLKKSKTRAPSHTFHI